MDIFEKCQMWQQEGNFDQIIDTVNKVPPEMRNSQLDLYLASAYCGISEGWNDRNKLKEVINLGARHLNEIKDSFLWSFNMGYALSHLGRDEEALPFFLMAAQQEKVPGSMKSYVDQCHQFLQLPIPEFPFRQRVESAWNFFEKHQPELLQLLESSSSKAHEEQLINGLYQFLGFAFNDISVTFSGDDEESEVILSPQNSLVQLFILDDFLKQKPKTISDKFKFSLGASPNPEAVEEITDGQISQDQIQTWIEEVTPQSYKVYLYNKDLDRIFPRDSVFSDQLIAQILYSAIGEIPAMKYVEEIERVDSPRNEPAILLSDLATKFKELGLNLDIKPEDLLSNTVTYTETPDESKDAIIRSDIKEGSSKCMQLIDDYKNAKTQDINNLQADGATAGFFMIFLKAFQGVDQEKKLKQFEEEFIKAIEDKAGKDSLTIVGNAIGTKAGYIDFIAWDLGAVLDAAKDYLQEAKKAHVGFHVFRRDGEVIGLYEGPIEGQEKVEIPKTEESAK